MNQYRIFLDYSRGTAVIQKWGPGGLHQWVLRTTLQQGWEEVLRQVGLKTQAVVAIRADRQLGRLEGTQLTFYFVSGEAFVPWYHHNDRIIRGATPSLIGDAVKDYPRVLELHRWWGLSLP